MTKLTTIIIDDEPLAHDILLAYSQNLPNVKIKGQCYSATEALNYLADNQVDMLFLDINMPMLTGLDLLKVLKCKPQVIITSAYQEYALESFEFDVTDYLLKPFSFERCLQACNKALAKHELLLQARNNIEKSNEDKTIFIKVDKKQCQFHLKDISCFEAYGNYVKVWYQGKSFLTARTLASFEQQLPVSEFTQIHRSVIVNQIHIDFINGQEITLNDGNTFSIGKSYKQKLVELLNPHS